MHGLCKQSYHEYGVLLNNEDTQHAESNWLTIQTAQKHIYLHICPEKKYLKIARSDRCEMQTIPAFLR